MTSRSFFGLQQKAVFFAVAALCVLGTYYRIGDQWSKSFWVDEVWRAQQISHAENYEVLQRGEYFGMEAPVQLSEYYFGKLGFLLFGETELGLRIWPLLFSLLSLGLFTRLVLHHMRPFPALFSLSLFALSPGLIEHAHEFKPYTFEVFLTILVFLWFLHDWKSKVWQSVAVLFLFPILLFGSNLWPFLSLLFFPLVSLSSLRKIPTLGYLFGGLLALPLSYFGAHFLWTYVEGLRANKIFRFWDPFFPTTFEKAHRVFDHNLVDFLDWYVDGPWKLWPEMNGIGITLSVLLFLALPGLLVWKAPQKGVGLSLSLWVPLAFSFLGMFPPFTRVGTFMMVPLLLVLGFSIDLFPYGRRVLDIAAPFLAVTLSCLVFSQFSWENYPGVQRHIQPMRELVEEIHQRVKDDDLIIPDYSAQLSFYFYKLPENLELDTSIGFPNKAVQQDQVNVAVEQLLATHPARRVWLISSHRVDGKRKYRETLREYGCEELFFWEKGHSYGILVRVPS